MVEIDIWTPDVDDEEFRYRIYVTTAIVLALLAKEKKDNPGDTKSEE
jgi:hypothetical protein